MPVPRDRVEQWRREGSHGYQPPPPEMVPGRDGLKQISVEEWPEVRDFLDAFEDWIDRHASPLLRPHVRRKPLGVKYHRKGVKCHK